MESNFKLYDKNFLNAGILLSVISILLLVSTLAGCTLSFQNISTHGTATDLVDENQSPTNTVSPNLNVPLKPL